MTVAELLADLADYFHDCTDGEDVVESYRVQQIHNFEGGIEVKFEDGDAFWIKVTPL